MALTNYERLKRWREKNRALYNLRRRNARKNLSECPNTLVANETDVHVGDKPLAQTSKDETLAKLRDLVRVEQEKPATEARRKPDVVGGIYRNDHGGVISKFAYEKLQRLKEKAKEGGYILDEYSQ